MGNDEYVKNQEMYLAVMNEQTRWLHDRFGISVQESQMSNKEGLIYQKILGFLASMLISLGMTILMNASTSQFFLETVSLSVGILSLSSYMLMLKENGGGETLLMPWLTSHQVVSIIVKNYVALQSVL